MRSHPDRQQVPTMFAGGLQRVGRAGGGGRVDRAGADPGRPWGAARSVLGDDLLPAGGIRPRRRELDGVDGSRGLDRPRAGRGRNRPGAGPDGGFARELRPRVGAASRALLGRAPQGSSRPRVRALGRRGRAERGVPPGLLPWERARPAGRGAARHRSARRAGRHARILERRPELPARERLGPQRLRLREGRLPRPVG